MAGGSDHHASKRSETCDPFISCIKSSQRLGTIRTPQYRPTLAASGFTFRSPPKGIEPPPPLSAPVGHRSILAEVRAGPPPPFLNPVLQPHRGSAARATAHEREGWQGKWDSALGASLASAATAMPRSDARTKVGWKVAKMDPLAWLAKVKVGDRRESSSGRGSGGNSRNGSLSRMSSPSSRSSDHENNRRAPSAMHRRSDSYNKTADERRDGEGNQSLQDE